MLSNTETYAPEIGMTPEMLIDDFIIIPAAPGRSFHRPAHQLADAVGVLMAPFYVGLMLFLVVISVLKPWKKWKK